MGGRCCIKTLEWKVCCHFQAVALNTGLFRDTRHSLGQQSHHLSRPISEAGLAPQREECRLGARRPGHIPRETPGPRASLRNSSTQLSLGAGEGTPANSLSFSASLCADWLAGKPGVGGRRGTSQSPGPETQRAGKGCLRGAERGEPEER